MMDRTFENNIKVYFAGCEQPTSAIMANAAGVKYLLWTVFPFIAKNVGIKAYPLLYGGKVKGFIPHIIENMSKSTIMDSGIFTLMFGAHAGKKDKKFIYKWFDLLTNFVNENKLKSICVEVDCQKVLGANQAWDLRYKIKAALPNNRIINVFHLDDGQKGLDRMIEYSDYIAVSVPELRFAGKRNMVSLTAQYIKNKKPSIDIHLLGCTDIKLLKNNRFCTSADSTSWQSPMRYGGYDGRKISSIKKEVDKELEDIVKNAYGSIGLHLGDGMIKRGSNAMVCAKLYKHKYEKVAGGQE